MDDGSSVTLSSFDLAKSLSCRVGLFEQSVLTFDAPADLKIRISFNAFKLKANESLVIGDGLVSGEDSQLSHFSGTALPSNVTSISNAAWINVTTSLTSKVTDIELIVEAVSSAGVFNFVFEDKHKINAVQISK